MRLHTAHTASITGTSHNTQRFTFEKPAPKRWLLGLVHYHIQHHTLNDNVEEQGAGGLSMIINVGL
jgi:hypothetical protein